jgi:hypothetical protein
MVMYEMVLKYLLELRNGVGEEESADFNLTLPKY